MLVSLACYIAMLLFTMFVKYLPYNLYYKHLSFCVTVTLMDNRKLRRNVQTIIDDVNSDLRWKANADLSIYKLISLHDQTNNIFNH